MSEVMSNVKMLVVGGYSGIGQAITQRARNEFGYDAVLRYAGSVRDDRDYRLFIGEEGPWTHVVYSAGIQRLDFYKDASVEDFRAVIDTNLIGYMVTLSALMGTQIGGRVVGVISDASTVPMRASAAYCASKAGMVAAMKVAAREGGANWCITGLSPGVVEGTPMTKQLDREIQGKRGWTEEEMLSYERLQQPTQRRTTIGEVVDAAWFLLFGPAQLTGTHLFLTGGRTGT